jgi:RNA polymerase sigma-70 factor (ECF subfamily)
MSDTREVENSFVDEDCGLVTACQGGDVDAFEVLVRKYQKRMVNIAVRMTGDYEDACEIVQESFLSAYKSIKRFRGEAKFSTWLYAICINHAKNQMRSEKNRSRYVQPPGDLLENERGSLVYQAASDDRPILEQLEKKEVDEKVQECICSLEDEYREVLVLRDIQGLSYEEIRGILDIPEGTVKSRLFRARESLRNRLKKALGDF